MSSAVLIGASAGGIDPLLRLVRRLPADLDAPVLVVVHIPPDAESRLPEILGRRCELPVAHAVDGEPLVPRRVYVAPPDRHLLVEDGVVRVLRGPRQNRHRPAIDALFRTGSRWTGSGTIAVILSGAAGDGVAGSMVVAHRGGRVIVQDPAEALFPGMPATVLEAVPQAVSLPVDDIAAAIDVAVGAREGVAAAAAPRAADLEVATMDEMRGSAPVEPGRPSYSCPDCGGVLEEIADKGPLRFRCRVGHEFYAEDLASAQMATLEDALWSAVRGMEETAELSARLARMAEEGGARRSASRHRERGEELLSQSKVIRDFLLRAVPSTDDGLLAERPEDERRAVAG